MRQSWSPNLATINSKGPAQAGPFYVQAIWSVKLKTLDKQVYCKMGLRLEAVEA
jgi:hypothetical protein